MKVSPNSIISHTAPIDETGVSCSLESRFSGFRHAALAILGASVFYSANTDAGIMLGRSGRATLEIATADEVMNGTFPSGFMSRITPARFWGMERKSVCSYSRVIKDGREYFATAQHCVTKDHEPFTQADAILIPIEKAENMFSSGVWKRGWDTPVHVASILPRKNVIGEYVMVAGCRPKENTKKTECYKLVAPVSRMNGNHYVVDIPDQILSRLGVNREIDGQDGLALSGMSGCPVFDSGGRQIGVTIQQQWKSERNLKSGSSVIFSDIRDAYPL